MKGIKSLFILGFVLSSLLNLAYGNDVQRAKENAKIFLKYYKCAMAKSALDSVVFQDNDVEFITLYVKTYSCKSKMLSDNDLIQIDSSRFLNSLATLPTSTHFFPGSVEHTSIEKTLDILLGFDGTMVPSTEARLLKFGKVEGTKLSMEALKVLLAQFGKALAYYGNTNSTGIKGSGSHGNSCIFSYKYSDAVDCVLISAPGSCTSAQGYEGSDALEYPETIQTIKRRMCEGVFYYNNILDILGNIEVPQIADLPNILTTQRTLLTAAEAAEIGAFNDGNPNGQNAISTIKGQTSLDNCMKNRMERIEKWYAVFFETIFY